MSSTFSLLTSYQQLFPLRPLLPNVSTVKWRGDFDETEFTLLFSSNLNSIIINSSGSTPPIFPSRLSAYSHSLRALAILNDQGCSMLIPNLPLPAALNLTTLIIPRIQIHDFELLLQISYLPKLTSASLAIDALTTVSPPKSTVQVTPQFPNLRSLTLSATTTMATRSLDSITGSPRYTLEILLTHTERLLTHDVVSLIENIGRLVPLSLTELAIKVEGQVATVESEHHDQPLTAMHLAQLRKFDALELLDLYLPCIFDLCDADISTLCHAFTKLQ
ncbi:hypothetical protein FRC03_007832 [Tulasnella sp. 419]|nr:hypothetical protein FRC03_007832 [Tulasnella sp. 419]